MSLIDTVRAKADALRSERDALAGELASIVEAVEAEERSDLNEAEATRFAEIRSKLDQLDGDIAAAEARASELAEVESRKAEAEARSREITPNRPQVRVGREERTYRPDSDHHFLSDALNVHLGTANGEVRERIERARAEALAEYRSTTGVFGTLVVPGYLTEQFAPVLRSGRPFLNAVTNLPLPDEGMNLYIPKGNTGTAVAAQATENTAVQNTTYDEDDLTVPVRTFAGQQVVSRQAVDRGRGIGEILLQDLYADYATKTNVSAINGAGTSGTHWGILNTTSVQTAAWTGTTGASLVSAIHNAIGKVNASRYQAADLIVMHPRRWAWLCAQSDTANRPLIQVDGPGFNAQGNGNAAGYGPVGSVAGVPVVIDAGVPTTLGTSTDEDRIIVTRRADVLHMEAAGAPVGLRFEEVLGDQLSVKMVVYGYSAFTAGRYPVATCNIQGTGFTQVLT